MKMAEKFMFGAAVAKPKKKKMFGSEEGDSSSGMDMSEESLAFVDDLFDAIESKDRDGAAMAMRGFVHSMEDEPEEEEEEMDESEDDDSTDEGLDY